MGWLRRLSAARCRRSARGPRSLRPAGGGAADARSATGDARRRETPARTGGGTPDRRSPPPSSPATAAAAAADREVNLAIFVNQQRADEERRVGGECRART